MSLAENLQYLRAREGVTQEQLAERLDVSRQSVSKWESAASYPEMDTLLKLCDMFQVDMDTLLRGSVEKSLSEDTAGYDRFMTLYARKIAGGVSAIVGSVALWSFLSALGLSEMLGTAMLLLVIAAAAVVFIASGMEEEHFRKKHPVIPDFYTEPQKERFHRRYIWYIAGGVGAILLGVVVMVLAFTVLPEREPYESYIGAAFLAVVACAVYFLIYGGMLEDKYNIAKYNRQNNPTPEDRSRRRRATTACSVIMILATAVFLFAGLAYYKWNWAAIIYPVGGVLCGAAWMLLGPRMEE
ncbi:MAG: helix-turn-helix domain-containing protein [Oscillospiraceae bacterium]|jgi:transcriptional regulator with XRE-family HTH domain|nr:helix-turn-helix domain-containing protein [Oscillospiraceae bacterium]